MEGNQTKMRDALSDVVGLLESILEAFSNGTGGVYMSDVAEAIDNANAVLAEPIRNCDVGTAEEQAERFKKFCFGHQTPWHGCTNCAVLMSEKCALTWGQMPYEAKEGDV